MHIDEAKGRLKTRFQTAFILKVFRRRLRLSESWKQWFEQQKTRACVPHTPYTLVLKFVPPAGKVCGVATHAVGRDAGYGLLLSKGKPYKVAVTACMRKLLTILNARMRDYFAENGTTENGIQTA